MSFMLEIANLHIGDRGRKQYDKLPELAASLMERQLQNIVVRKPTDKDRAHPLYLDQEWVLVVGGRRTAAALVAGIPALRAEPLEDLPEWKQKAIELEENLQRENLNFTEETEMKLQVHELYKAQRELAGETWDQKDTAKLLGQSNATITRDLSLAKATREDPSLAKATSKKAAIRAAETKAIIRRREAEIKNIDWGSLRARLHSGDMRDYLRTLPTASVDLLFSDLPYGIGYFDKPSSSRQAGGGISKFDDSEANVKDLLIDAIPQMIRVTKKTGWMVLMMQWENFFFLQHLIQCCCAEHYEYGVADVKSDEFGFPATKLPRSCSHPESSESVCRFLRCEDIPWQWYRPNSRNNPMHPELHAQNQYELISVTNMGEGRIYQQERFGNVFAVDSDYDGRVHAHQKPDELADQVIRAVSLPGQRVIDICAGSGAFLRSACKLGRDFAGCELNPDVYEILVSRVSEFFGVVRKPSLALVKDTCPDCGADLDDGECPSCTTDEGGTSTDDDEEAELDFDHEPTAEEMAEAFGDLDNDE